MGLYDICTVWFVKSSLSLLKDRSCYSKKIFNPQKSLELIIENTFSKSFF